MESEHSKLASSRIQRYLFLSAGLLCVGLGAAGAFLPVLPCTPFILLAVYCFARSSPMMHGWLKRSRLFGGVISDWEIHRAIRRRTRYRSFVIVIGVVALTLFLVKPSGIIICATLAAAAFGLVVISRIPVYD